MKKYLLLLILLTDLTIRTNAQVMSYGTIDTADLKMTSCDFEKGANAEVLFDKATVVYEFSSIVMERHKRVKIFNDNGKNEANIRIEFFSKNRYEIIKDIVAETINLNNKSIEYNSVDPKLIYTQMVNKYVSALIFSFPNVKTGSVVEFKYKWIAASPYNYPDWSFQTTIPTRYSEFNGSFSKDYGIDSYLKVVQPTAKDTGIKIDFGTANEHIWALSNVKSYKVEAYTDYPDDYVQCLVFETHHNGATWITVGKAMLNDKDFGQQLDDHLGQTDTIIAKARLLKTTDEKIAYVFNTVKKLMTWNKTDYWCTIDGVKKAWDKKTGNSTEINLILYNLLNLVNVKTCLMALSTRSHGRIIMDYPSTANFDKTVIYYPIDSARYYVLDASNPYNSYNNIPFDLIGLDALSIDPKNNKLGILRIKNGESKEAWLVEGEISADGRFVGNTRISSAIYDHQQYLKKYNDLGEKKYTDQLQDQYPGLKISSLKLENTENDTLPLIQDFDFKYKLTEPDGDYMYFSPGTFPGFGSNPFLSETRVSDIDFGCLYSYSINCRYKLPAGYKANVLPKSLSMAMPDNGIIFRRFVSEQDGIVNIRFTINYKRSVFSKTEYTSLRTFYKKMYEMFDEQVVLKKS